MTTQARKESEYRAMLGGFKKALGRYLRETRKGRGLTAEELAGQIGVSRAVMLLAESGDDEITTDLQLRALLACGQKASDVARVLLEEV